MMTIPCIGRIEAPTASTPSLLSYTNTNTRLYGLTMGRRRPLTWPHFRVSFAEFRSHVIRRSFRLSPFASPYLYACIPACLPLWLSACLAVWLSGCRHLRPHDCLSTALPSLASMLAPFWFSFLFLFSRNGWIWMRFCSHTHSMPYSTSTSTIPTPPT